MSKSEVFRYSALAGDAEEKKTLTRAKQITFLNFSSPLKRGEVKIYLPTHFFILEVEHRLRCHPYAVRSILLRIVETLKRQTEIITQMIGAADDIFVGPFVRADVRVYKIEAPEERGLLKPLLRSHPIRDPLDIVGCA